MDRPAVTSEPRVLSATAIVGEEVVNAAGERVGKIEELMIDLDLGRVAYVVLSFGGVMGLGQKLFAIPFEALRIDPEGRDFVLNVDREKLRNAPGFDKHDWPRAADRRWGAQIHSYYGFRPYWEDPGR